MFGIGTATMSSKGQIVIPANLREDFKEGDSFIFTRKGNALILQKASEVEKKFAEDLIVAERVAQAWKRYKEGKFKSLTKEQFLKELNRW